MNFVADCMLGRLAKWLRDPRLRRALFAKAEDRGSSSRSPAGRAASS